MRQTVFIVGHFGFRNTGDEAILLSLITHLREIRGDLGITVASGNPEKTARDYHVDAVKWSDVSSLHRAISASDLVILGGGGIFHDYAGVQTETALTDNHWGLSYFSGTALIATLHRKPVMIYATGMGPLFSKEARTFTRFACEAAAAVTVRDSDSRDVLEKMGVRADGVLVTADAAFGLPPGPSSPPSPDLDQPRPFIAVAPRAWSFGIDEDYWQNELATGLDIFLEANACKVIFVPFQRNDRPELDDAEAAERITERMRLRARASVLHRDLSPFEARALLSTAKLVVGMRAHANVLAMCAGVPVVGLRYDPKVWNIMAGAGLADFVLPLDSLERQKLADTMACALTHQTPVDISALAQAARQNARIAMEILQASRTSGVPSRAIAAGIDTRHLVTELEQLRAQDALQRTETKRLQTGLELKTKELEHIRQAHELLVKESARARLEWNASLTTAETEQAKLENQLVAYRTQLDKERATLQTAQELHEEAVTGIDHFHHRISSNLVSYRSERAWKVMVTLRKGYALLTRKGVFSFLKWCLTLPFQGPGDLHEFELDFPNIWNFLPERLQMQMDVRNKIAAVTLPTHNYDLIVFPIFDFEFRFQRPQQIAAQFSRNGHRVFWISPSRFVPEASESLYEAVPLRENLWEVRLRGRSPDLYGSSESAGYEKPLAALFRDFQIRESGSLLQFPYWRKAGLALRERFGTKVVYDCMDDWQHWTADPRISAFNLDEENRLARECDVLVASSAGLCERHQAAGLEPLLVRNGADFAFFADRSISATDENFPRPVIGYYGAIANWFDLDLLAAVAQARPQYHFVLTGQVHQVDVSRLKSLPNVSFLGEKVYREIPRLLAHFDVALIPFKINTLTQAVDPVKLYEYFSQGKPVVATPMKELERCSGLVYVASNPQEFAHQIDRALEENDRQLRTERVNFARANTWAARVEQIDRAVCGTYPLVSILIVTYNCSEFIGPCLDSIARNTSWPNYEVIVIDNHSDDSSGGIAAERAASDARIRIINHDTNAGFAAANNIAARFARGEYLLFLNPDTIVTPGWIGRLVRHFERSPKTGAVAALTNFSGNETKINTDYRDVLEMQNFAMDLAAKHYGEARDIDMAALYCVLVSKAVWDTVGQLDEDFQVGTFEDDDFSLRIKRSGYRVIAAEDCFIHHFGNGSFAKLPSKESLRIFERNRQRFEHKWETVWKPHQLRPGVRSPYEEMRLTPDEFLVISSSHAPRGPEPIVLRRLHPANTRAGELFNLQTDGTAAIVVECANATPTTVIVFGSTTLATSYASANMLSGIVPPVLYSKPGRYPVKLLNDFGESNGLDFEVHGG